MMVWEYVGDWVEIVGGVLRGDGDEELRWIYGVY